MAFRRPNRQAALPPTFRCRLCGQDQAPVAYSKNQLQKWYSKKRADRRNEVTPETIGLICLNHATGDERALRCHGPCDRLKAVEQFSKAQRNNLEPWCLDCTDWRGDFEGLEVPPPIPNGPSAQNVSDGAEATVPPTFAYDYDEPENSDDDDMGDNYYDPSVATSIVDRLPGYDNPGRDEDTMTNAATTADTVEISLWGGENAGAGESVVGSDDSGRTVTGNQPGSMRSGQTSVGMHGSYQFSLASNPSQAVTSGSLTSTRAGIPSHLSRLASLHHNSHRRQNNQVPRSVLTGRLVSDFGHSTQLSQGNVSRRAVALGDEPLKANPPNNEKPTGMGSQACGNNEAWYRGERLPMTYEPRELATTGSAICKTALAPTIEHRAQTSSSDGQTSSSSQQTGFEIPQKSSDKRRTNGAGVSLFDALLNTQSPRRHRFRKPVPDSRSQAQLSQGERSCPQWHI
ncbi:hypothetical protein GGR50DRAFT_701265 [Xylaria sp. CBS 124048]|nr:hypothetical protein GGR50DRAFT_701265 [Xylaria sp. CBS 124048]